MLRHGRRRGEVDAPVLVVASGTEPVPPNTGR